jgi:hypothetical protein
MTFTSKNLNFTILVADEQLQTMRLNRLYRDWRLAMQGRWLPGAEFIDKTKLSYLDGMLVIVDIEKQGDQLRFRYRSVGHHFIEHLKVDPAGTYMDQHPESSFAITAMRACSLVVEARRPIHARIDRDIDGRLFIVEFLLLPLSDTGSDVDTLLIGQIFAPAGGAP